MKYIILEKECHEVAVLLPDLMLHSEAFNVCGEAKPIAAGFCKLDIVSYGFKDHYDATCWGESTTLGLKSRGKEDEAAIEFTLSLPVTVPTEALPVIAPLRDESTPNAAELVPLVNK